jgi:hypothetical protein
MGLTNRRWLSFFFVGLSMSGVALGAQQPRHSPSEVGQIVDAAIAAVIPPETSLTSYTVAERGVRFDYLRTMSAFGFVGDLPPLSSLRLRSDITLGTRELLSDCDQLGSKSCTQLGQSVYVLLEPVSFKDSEAIVWLHVHWVTKSGEHSFLSGFSRQVHLARSRSKPWRFVRTGKGIIA